MYVIEMILCIYWRFYDGNWVVNVHNYGGWNGWVGMVMEVGSSSNGEDPKYNKIK